jgi:hypothetical protein
MALSRAIAHIESNGLARMTNYGQYLEEHPPTHEVEIIENSSWGCIHGIERWKSDCGCHSGSHPGWNQAWRAPLREVLDGLRDAVGPNCEQTAGQGDNVAQEWIRIAQMLADTFFVQLP